MKLRACKCPECGARIEVDASRDSCFCTYCGSQIIFEDENKRTINKNININKNATYTERYINEAEVINAKSREKHWLRNLILGIVIPVVIVLFFVGVFMSAKHSSDVEEERLQDIVEEVMIDIENGNFDEAYIKAESIRYTADWSSDIEEKWDKTRRTLIEKIKKAEKEAKGSRPFLGLFG